MNWTQALGVPHNQVKARRGLAAITAARFLGSTAVFVLLVSSCAGFSRERLVYDTNGIRIGVQQDPTISGSSPLALNSHPARLSETDLQTLLRFLQVSGYSGTIGGLFATPRPIPLFSEEELRLIAQPLANAFVQAGPQERVFFSIPNLSAPYRRERTEGALFFRGPYLHVVLTDHSAITATDTAGGEDLKDLRDTKGMKLWISGPGKEASLSPEEAPRWGPFETVHISMNVRDILTARESPTSPAQAVQAAGPANKPIPGAQAQDVPKSLLGGSVVTDSNYDLRLQIRELTSSNLELRSRLKEQAEAMQSLKEELDMLRQDLKDQKVKSASPRKSPSR